MCIRPFYLIGLSELEEDFVFLVSGEVVFSVDLEAGVLVVVLLAGLLTLGCEVVLLAGLVSCLFVPELTEGLVVFGCVVGVLLAGLASCLFVPELTEGLVVFGCVVVLLPTEGFVG